MPTPDASQAAERELGLRGLVDIAAGYQRAQVLFAANELGVFRALTSGARPLSELASTLELEPRALAPLLEACTALGLLRRQGHRFENSRSTSLFLGRDDPSSFVPVLRFWRRFGYGLWGRLTDAIAQNQPQTADGPKGDDLFDGLARDEEQLEVFFAGLHGLARWPAQKLAGVVDLSACAHLVDVGGGTGAYAEALLQRYPRLRITLFDLAPACRLARRHWRERPGHERIGILEGDFRSEALPECDALLLSNVLHDWGADEIRSLLRRSHEALRPGGLLVIHDFMPEESTTSAESAMFSLALLLDTRRGRVYTRAEHRRWLAELGYAETHDEPISGGTRVMTARRVEA